MDRGVWPARERPLAGLNSTPPPDLSPGSPGLQALPCSARPWVQPRRPPAYQKKMVMPLAPRSTSPGAVAPECNQGRRAQPGTNRRGARPAAAAKKITSETPLGRSGRGGAGIPSSPRGEARTCSDGPVYERQCAFAGGVSTKPPLGRPVEPGPVQHVRGGRASAVRGTRGRPRPDTPSPRSHHVDDAQARRLPGHSICRPPNPVTEAVQAGVPHPARPRRARGAPSFEPARNGRPPVLEGTAGTERDQRPLPRRPCRTQAPRVPRPSPVPD